MRLAAVAVAVLALCGCASTSVSVGPQIVHAPSLGWDSPYLGATARVDVERGGFVARAEGSYFAAHKTQTGDGYAGSAEALAGAKFGRWSALAGLRGNRYVTSAYSKDSSQYLAQGGYHFRSGGIVSATGSLEADGSGWYSYGLRCEAPTKHVLFVSSWERMIFQDQGLNNAIGDRVSLSALWRF